jgi:pSer/pThr/pTyr-binding forkhead associated (FHA) protein
MFPSGDRPRFTIGRDAACDLVLADLSVSRWHAGLKRGASGWMLDDLGSTNGTRVNGWRVTEPVPVRPGDQVTFGAVTFVIAAPGAAAAPTGGW